jgi:hypothetical protein
MKRREEEKKHIQRSRGEDKSVKGQRGLGKPSLPLPLFT